MQQVVSGASVGGLLSALWRNRFWVMAPVLAATVVTYLVLSVLTPQYKSTANVLIENQETAFTRPSNTSSRVQDLLDTETIRSQVQLMISADLSREIVKQLGLEDRAEFSPALGNISALSGLLARVGLGRDPKSMTDYERILDRHYSNLTVFPVRDSRVITIEFVSVDRQLAAKGANAVADGYIAMQKSAKQNTTREPSGWLSGQIDTLREKVATAEHKVEAIRSEHGLHEVLRGSENGSTIDTQQLSELSTQLTHARSHRPDAQARARRIRESLSSGGIAQAAEVFNSQLIQRLQERQVCLQAQIAELSSTLSPRHPRMKEMNAQLADLRQQIRAEAEKIAYGLENEARVAAEREEQLGASLEALKAPRWPVPARTKCGCTRGCSG